MSRDPSKAAAWLRERVLDYLQEAHSGLKPSVARLAARRVGLSILGNWLTCWDPIHLRGLRGSMALEAGLRKTLGPLVDLACQELFHGHVIPIQRVLLLIDEAREAALGKCVCRASGVTQDLMKHGRVYLWADADNFEEHLHRILDAYERIIRGPSRPEHTSPRLLAILEAVRTSQALSARERLEILFEQTFPFWEILLHHQDMRPEWRENMRGHRKSWPVERELLKAFALAHYHLRGAVFTFMEAVDQPYALCTCPGPENDGGCSLVNWYYFSRLDGALYPNVNDFFGQRRDEHGKVLPCNLHPQRASRPCLGCGCEHEVKP